jgi:hypothetical protein
LRALGVAVVVSSADGALSVHLVKDALAALLAFVVQHPLHGLAVGALGTNRIALLDPSGPDGVISRVQVLGQRRHHEFGLCLGLDLFGRWFARGSRFGFAFDRHVAV